MDAKTKLEEMGFQPAAADGGWNQFFDIVGVNATVPKTWTFENLDGKVTLDCQRPFPRPSAIACQ